jgi:hypothetical protein
MIRSNEIESRSGIVDFRGSSRLPRRAGVEGKPELNAKAESKEMKELNESKEMKELNSEWGLLLPGAPEPRLTLLRRQGFRSVFQTALRGLSNRSIVVVCNYGLAR